MNSWAALEPEGRGFGAKFGANPPERNPGSNGKLQVRNGPSGADDGIRTRDPHLGKVVLYQLSHVRAVRKFIRRPGGGQAPVEPNPPVPRDVSVRSTTSMGSSAE
jgi:hypothetical protein